MGTASTLGSFGAIAAFAIGLYVGVTAPFPWPVAWAAGLTLGVLLSATATAVFEFVDARKRYSFDTFGTHLTRDVYEEQTVEDCFSCSGADHDGVRVEWSKDDVWMGLVQDRHGGGISYYCSTCQADSIEAGLRAGKEREFRERYEGDDHYFDVLEDLRAWYLEYSVEGDFWAFVEAAMDRVDDAEDDVTNPMVYVEAVATYNEAESVTDFWDRLADRTGEGRDELQERFEGRGWFFHIHSKDQFTTGGEPDEVTKEEAEEMEPLH